MALEVNLALLKIEEKVAEMHYRLKFSNKTANPDMVDEMVFGVTPKSKRNAPTENLESNFTEYLKHVENTITKNSIKSYNSSFNHVVDRQHKVDISVTKQSYT